MPRDKTPARLARPKRLWAVRAALLFLVAAATLFLFYNSSAPGAVSGQASSQLTGWLLGSAETDPAKPVETGIRKLGHIAEYALLGLVLFAALRSFAPRPLRYFGWPMAYGLLAGVLDELYQLSVPGRSGRLTDVLIDFAGVLLGLFLGLAVHGIVKWHRARRQARPTAPANI